jgi:hypothetical protein
MCFKEKEDKLIFYSAKKLLSEIHNLEKSYENIVDNDLCEACVYEILAKKSRYKYIERMAKERNLNLSFNFKE